LLSPETLFSYIYTLDGKLSICYLEETKLTCKVAHMGYGHGLRKRNEWILFHLVSRTQQTANIGRDNSTLADLPHRAAMLFFGVNCCNFLDKLAIGARRYLHNLLIVI